MIEKPNDRMSIHIDAPPGLALPSIIRAIADEIEMDDSDSGYVEDVHWRLSTPADGVTVDPRQREAASLLIMAFDLPQEMTSCAKSMQEAALVNPGMRLTAMSGRIAALREVRRLVDQMLDEQGERRPVDRA